MVTAIAWVPRGFAAPFPTKYAMNAEEFARIAELAKLQLDDANEDLEEARNGEESNDVDAMENDEGSDDEAATQGIRLTGYATLTFLCWRIFSDPA